MIPQLLTDLAAAFPTPDSATRDIITVVVDDVPLGKQFALVGDKVEKQAKVSTSNAVACQFHVPDLTSLQRMLEMVANDTNAAITNCGWSPVPVGEPFRMVSKRNLSEADRDPER